MEKRLYFWDKTNNKLYNLKPTNEKFEGQLSITDEKKKVLDTLWKGSIDLSKVVVPNPCPPNMHWDDTLGKCVETVIPPVGDLDENGMKMLYKTTGKFVEIIEGKDHENGQRFSKNHSFLNYMVIGYFKLGKGQDVLEHKTDGPNHGGCNDEADGDVPSKFPIEDCCWIEVNVSLTDRKGYKAGQFYLASEHPHPKNFDAPESGKGKIFKIKEGQWVGYAAVAWQEGEFRHIQGWIDTDPFNVDGTPKNNWELGIDLVDTGQLTTPHLAKRKIPIDHVKNDSMKGLESEFRMNNAVNHDTDIKFCRVYEIIPPT